VHKKVELKNDLSQLISALSFVQVELWTLQLRAWPVWGTLGEGEEDVIQIPSQKKGPTPPPKNRLTPAVVLSGFHLDIFYHLPDKDKLLLLLWDHIFYFHFFFAGNTFLCILAVPNGPSGNLKK